MLDKLPAELVHRIAYDVLILSPRDVVNLACVNKSLTTVLLGDRYSRDRARRWRATQLALRWCSARDGLAALWALLVPQRDVVADSLEWSEAAATAIKAFADSEVLSKDELLARACKRGHTLAVAALIKHSGYSPTDDDCLAFRLAAQCGHLDIVEFLAAQEGVDAGAYNNYAVRWAARYGRVDVVRFLLAHPAVDPAADNNCAVRWAGMCGQIATLRLLLADPRVDPTANNSEALRKAAHVGCATAVRLLLDDGRCDPRAEDDYALKWALKYGHATIVAALEAVVPPEVVAAIAE
ncbi:uncharacterized protein AMSG_05430 [Thecamonas trahens ATCC 50062]|uniref:Uncharacterized protein n=1 Tax=Thecamonas trahens ATCC 50062 TaxID=461836 RepID=A0A0L0DB09_THETB|nr:hypothetical protein AMSG_05430 [Thecamonas trahens ATCC 50062]KNC49425.1 hypothetical protein AMSG_05430 [Thecamonas trahens ATCC 50062]|eukprot:XP_013757848.1 hypothetical protein AMSG_05430 [Thecamonas trahens ATCC 50062]